MFTTSSTAENLRLALTETACSEHVCTKLFYSKQTIKHNSSQREREQTKTEIFITIMAS